VITVIAAPPFATVQDLGRDGHRALGVPVSGAMDRAAMIACNRIVGSEDGAAVIEWALAGGTLRFDAATTIALGGATVSATLRGKSLEPLRAYDVRAGDELRVERFVRGRFLYVAVRGGIDVPLVLGSRSTLLSASLGGFEGRRLRKGDVLRIGGTFAKPRTVTPPAYAAAIPVLRGPQHALFDDDTWHRFLETEFRVAPASDRSGYRLGGPELPHSAGAAFPSEPACVGAIQVPAGGAPIVLMPDGPTVGGYPKIAVVRTDAISRLAQRVPGDVVRFNLDG
jgi:biotin-dependent carboxylase-like uncharacterized protein